jgi:hypothetical protein
MMIEQGHTVSFSITVMRDLGTSSLQDSRAGLPEACALETRRYHVLERFNTSSNSYEAS